MSGHEHHEPHRHGTGLERRSDVVVLGATAAGLGTARLLSAQGRSVIVLEAGDEPDATDDLADVREEVRRHGGQVLAARAIAITPGSDGNVRVAVVGGHTIVTRRVLVAGSALDAADSFGSPDTSGSTAEEQEWDGRYGGAPVWSGNPNGTLVAEVTAMTPGRALDVGAGEGGDAVWLAERGWQVTANDVSGAGLGRVATVAEQRGVAVTRNHADANAPDPFGGQTFDLVSVQYPAIPRRPDDRGIRNLLAAVAPGGTLLMVGHDLAPMRRPIDTAVESRMFDPDANVRVSDVAAAVAGNPAWVVEVHEIRPRPPGAASGHHVDDEVLRARRIG